MEKTTFEAVISAPWTKDEEESGLIFVTTDEGASGAVCEFILIWDEYYPISQALSEKDTEKMYRLLLHAGEMFRFLRTVDSPGAKLLIEKIERIE